MEESEKEGLIASPGKVLEREVPDAEFEAFSRAGRLLVENDLAELDMPRRDPKDFFLGHPVQFSELHRGVVLERKSFQEYLVTAKTKLSTRYPQTLIIRSRPGAGASTALRRLAYRLAFHEHIPTLILDAGGLAAFEAIERLHRLVGRSFVVVADPQNVAIDELTGLRTRCAPLRIPVVFLTSQRVLRAAASPASSELAELEPASVPPLEIELSSQERDDFLKRLIRFCPSVPFGRLAASRTRSLFLLTLEAFGDANVRVETFVRDLLDGADENQTLLLAVIAFFSRYAHRNCSEEFLQVLSGHSFRGIRSDLEMFDQLLVLQDGDDWACRHDQLSKAILEWNLTKAFDGRYRYELAAFACKIIERLGKSTVGQDLAAEYVWSTLNPQVEAQFGPGGERARQSRLIGGEDGLPNSPARYQVFKAASTAFPRDVNIIGHFGKYLSEEEKRFDEADDYLIRAYELDPKNEATSHMLGKRYFDELREILRNHPPYTRLHADDRVAAAIVRSGKNVHAAAASLPALDDGTWRGPGSVFSSH